MVGLIVLATLLPLGAGASAGVSPTRAPASGGVTILDWDDIAQYPNTPEGWDDCHADGKLWGGRYRCILLLSGWVELQIWRP
ncbi:hypothetical protein [Spongiactinospora sp. TRM90649]|uniref:hypothetical protein n=1 Tax=Spongiactinospora sp. TRM90649 TaxID=3031114 RepID=UPI0023F91FA5|nr:hypothetical protein [Spongiactinospora sp. TRM90649]MDF5755897.1 hypothetical protein [Spongiactinospora sp. TRM90649]